MPTDPVVTAAVEGVVDEAVVRRLVEHVRAVPGDVYGRNGKPHLRERINGYSNAPRHTPWLVLVDLDSDADCAPNLRQAWLRNPAAMLCFRVAVPQVEAWLMADADTLARYLSVPRGRIPCNTEALPNAKIEVVNLARGSRKRATREDMVPRPGSGRPLGPAYSSRLIEYVQHYWRPEVAAQHADSLRLAIACLERLVEDAK